MNAGPPERIAPGANPDGLLARLYDHTGAVVLERRLDPTMPDRVIDLMADVDGAEADRLGAGWILVIYDGDDGSLCAVVNP